MARRGRQGHVVTPVTEIEEEEQASYVLDGIIAPRELCLVYGGEKEGKSTWMHKLCICMTSEGLEDFDGIPVMRGRVLYVSLDIGARQKQVKPRMRRIAERLGTTLSPDLMVTHNTTFLDDPESVESLLRAAPGPFALVVIDPLYRALMGGDPGQPGAINMAIESVIRIIEETGAAVVILNHDTKGSSGTMYGSKFLGAAADCKIFVKRPNLKNKVIVTVEMVKNGEPPETPFHYDLEKEFLKRTDRAATGDGKSDLSAFPHADALALLPTTDTLKRDARKCIAHLFTGKATGHEKQWQRWRKDWTEHGATVETDDTIRRIVGEDVS